MTHLAGSSVITKNDEKLDDMEGALGTTSLTSQWALNKEDTRLCRTGMLRCNPRDLRLDCPLDHAALQGSTILYIVWGRGTNSQSRHLSA